MFSRLSLKYRIALIVFILETIMLSLVLWQTLAYSYKESSKLIQSNQEAIFQLIGGISRTALLTEEYAELQPYIENLLVKTEATQLYLADVNANIVASSITSDLGRKLPDLEDGLYFVWHIKEINNAAGLMGTLAIKFSSSGLMQTHIDARDFGITIAIIGMLIIAAVGLIVGFLLTRRLGVITNTAQLVAAGDLTARTNISAQDEVGKLASTFDNMVQHLLESQNNLSQTLSNLQEREESLSVTLNSIGDAVIATDINGNVTRMNSVAENMTGWSLAEAKMQPLKTIFPIVDASTREMIANPIEKVISTGETIFLSNHTTLISKSGVEYQIADSAAPIRNNNNQVLGMVLIFSDVTEQYKLREEIHSSEQHLKLYREQAPMATIEWDLDFKVIDWNKAAEKMFGYRVDEVRGLNFTDFMLPENAVVDVKRIWKDLISQKGGTYSLNENLTKDGRTILCEWHNTTLVDEDGKVIGAASIVQDVTNRKRQEEELRRSQKMDALGKLTGGIAHDYNNMLGVIVGYSELLCGMLKDQSKSAGYANQILRAGERGSKLTKKLLSFSRHKNSNAEIININALLTEERMMLEKTLTARIELVYELDDDLWPVWLDGGELEDVIINLSINAMHAIDGSGRLAIQTRNAQVNEADAQFLEVNSGDYVLLTVSDTGCGMDKVTEEKMFDPFFSTKGEQGTGLGLSQVYGLVKRSNGAIKVYSELGQGTMLQLYFPRYINHDHQHKIEEIVQDEDLNGTEKILIVDDEPSICSLSYEILSNHGYHAFCANSAKQALDILEKEEIDLLLSDIIMPNMDGYELAGIVQKEYPHIKIQLASGFNDKHNVDMVDQKLQYDLLQKPYTSKKLLKRIRDLLNG